MRVESGNGDGSVKFVTWESARAWNDSKAKSSVGKKVYFSGGIVIPIARDFKCHQKVAPDATSSS